MIDSDDNNLFLKLEFHYEVVSSSWFHCRVCVWLFLLLNLICFFVCFLDGFRFFKEPAGIVCHPFEAFSRGRILLKSEMTSFIPIIFKLFFKGTGFALILRMFSRFHSHF